ncbi:MAG: hypothetical protein PHD82_07945, partial [Candidatus Riflebacteria bacterium]|nr:hypothetical protein [Candidatus Riflebacteria bacterium]
TRKIWQSIYRQILIVCLACCVFLPSGAVEAQDERISRYEFVSAVYERTYNRKLTELETVNSGLLDPFDDGSYHLDFSISRGMAVEALYRLSIQAGTAARLPRAFADITPDSIFRKPLETVGGAFLPLKRGRFEPNHLITRQTLFHAVKTLIDKGVLKQEDRYSMKILPVFEPVISASTKITADSPAISAEDGVKSDTGEDKLYAINPELGFQERRAADGQYKAAAYERIARADSRVSFQQMNPQTMASIEDAANAMADVEKLFARLGGSIMEMTSTYPSNPDDEQILRSGLAEIEGVLDMVLNRFEYSKLQLGTVMPVDPGQVKKCDQLNSQLEKNLEQAKMLKKRIGTRLAEPQKGANVAEP